MLDRYDARWDEGRDRGGSWDRDRGTRGGSGERDRNKKHDSRDVLTKDLDMPRGPDRELVRERGRTYELNGAESRMPATVGAFRVVSESDVHDQLTRAVSGRWAAADATDGAVPRAAGGAAREGGGGSHLAMRGAPIKAIQELAGYRELGVTQRYMHLSPAALDSAIRLLDQSPSVKSFGDILETVVGVEGKING